MKEMIYAFYMLVGTYTGTGSEGIYVYGFDPETARTEYVGMARVENPSYLTVSADGRMVYAVSENGQTDSHANALSFDPTTGELILIDSEYTSGGAPCNIVSNGRIVLTANYFGGDISVFGIEPDGGLTSVKQILRLPGGESGRSDSGIPEKRAKPSRMHCVKFSPDGRYLFATDLGTDKILRYNVADGGTRIDESSLATFDLPEGSGPRHFIFDREGRKLYLINEYSGCVAAFDYNGGELRELQSIASDTVVGRSSADIVITPDNKYLYSSNRAKNDGIAMFSTGKILSRIGYKTTGRFPRNLSIVPGGKFLLSANHGPGTVEVFEIDYGTGLLSLKDEATVRLDKPVCVVFVAAKTNATVGTEE